jgi:hypothetical protein
MAPRPCAGGVGLAAQPGAGDLLIQLGDQLIQLASIHPGRLGVVAHGLGLSAVLDPRRLHVIGRRRVGDGLGVQVPAFGALRRPQYLGPLGARRAFGGEGGAAGNEHLVGLAGFGVDAAELDGVQAGAVGFGDCPYRVAGGGVGEPVGPRGASGHWLPPSCQPSRW